MYYIINDTAVIAAVSVLRLNSDIFILCWNFDNSSSVQPPSGPIAKLFGFLVFLSKLSPLISKHVVKTEKFIFSGKNSSGKYAEPDCSKAEITHSCILDLL